MTEKQISSETIYQGRVIEVRKDQVLLPDGQFGMREVVVTNDAVAVIALNERQEVLLVKQYRHPAGQNLWEIPAGKIEAGETPLQSAQRELEEETGYRAKNWRSLSSFYMSPGFCTERIHLLIASDLTEYQQKLDQDEFIEVGKFVLAEALQMVEKRDIIDAKTIIGLFAADREL